MVQFTAWTESFIALGIFSLIVLVPCLCIAMMGKNLVEQLGNYPSKTPVIQMGVFLRLVGLELLTAFSFFAFYKIFVS